MMARRAQQFPQLEKSTKELPEVTSKETSKPVPKLGALETQRKRAEEALRESEAKYSTLVENSRDGIVILRDGVLKFANTTYLNLVGYTPEELIGTDFLRMVTPQNRKMLIKRYTDRIAGKEGPSVYEIALIRKDGMTLPVELNATFIDYEGRPADLIFVRDITERRRREGQLALIGRLTAIITSSADVSEVYDAFIAELKKVMDVHWACITLIEKQELRIFALSTEIGLNWAQGDTVPLKETATEWVARNKQTLVEQDLSQRRMFWTGDYHLRLGMRSVVHLPLLCKGEVFGCLVLGSQKPHAYGEKEVELLELLASQIGGAIDNARLYQLERKAREEMSRLSITDELTGLYNRRHFYEVLEVEMQRTRRYGRSFALVMLDLDGFKEYNDKFGHTNGDAVLQSLAQALKSTLRKSDTAFRYGGDEFTIILPATHAERSRVIVDRIRSKWLRTPKVQYPFLERPLAFSAGVAQFPEHAETADGLVFLADTALYHAKRQGGCKCTVVSDLATLSPDVGISATLDQVYALAAMVDARDPHTYGHSKRVATIAEMIGKTIGLSETELANLHAACLVHDIGKVGIPDSLLIKPGKPTDEEWRLVKKHCAEGARIVGYVSELAPLVPVILHHHEWYDGTGYPEGLKGEDIPIGARIISVADAYDTMTTPRPYREVISQEETLEILRQCSGTQFDPELVEALCQAISQAPRQA
jgi:diguanylate cyclase (GGDEF)-like protein/PAS domain S-box-containing protein